jgi:hypothetical protein
MRAPALATPPNRGSPRTATCSWIPTALRIGSARFFFYSNEGSEPPHVHVEQAGAVAKFWLQPVSLAASSRFRVHELRRLEAQVIQHPVELLRAWNDHFAC